MEHIKRTLLRRGRLSSKELLEHPSMLVKKRQKKQKVAPVPRIRKTRRVFDRDMSYKVVFLYYGSLTDFSQ